MVFWSPKLTSLCFKQFNIWAHITSSITTASKLKKIYILQLWSFCKICFSKFTLCKYLEVLLARPKFMQTFVWASYNLLQTVRDIQNVLYFPYLNAAIAIMLGSILEMANLMFTWIRFESDSNINLEHWEFEYDKNIFCLGKPSKKV